MPDKQSPKTASKPFETTLTIVTIIATIVGLFITINEKCFKEETPSSPAPKIVIYSPSEQLEESIEVPDKIEDKVKDSAPTILPPTKMPTTTSSETAKREVTAYQVRLMYSQPINKDNQLLVDGKPVSLVKNLLNIKIINLPALNKHYQLQIVSDKDTINCGSIYPENTIDRIPVLCK